MFTERDIERAEKMNTEVWAEIDNTVKALETKYQNMPQEVINASIQGELNNFFFKKLAQLENQIEELRNKDGN